MGHFSMKIYDPPGSLLNDNQHRQLTVQITSLTNRIENPKTGYAIRLAQSRTNEGTLEAQLESQNAKLELASKESAANLIVAKSELKRAQAQTLEANKRVADLLKYQAKGDTPEARVVDLDKHFVESLRD